MSAQKCFYFVVAPSVFHEIGSRNAQDEIMGTSGLSPNLRDLLDIDEIFLL